MSFKQILGGQKIYLLIVDNESLTALRNCVSLKPVNKNTKSVYILATRVGHPWGESKIQIGFEVI